MLFMEVVDDGCLDADVSNLKGEFLKILVYLFVYMLG